MTQSNIHHNQQLASLAEQLAQTQTSTKQKLKLLIHVGTPKTGTTSLQRYLDKKQRKLRALGILYPHNLDTMPNPNTPKHQWFEKNLLTTHTENFVANFRNIINQIKPNTHTIILSSEGIFNYWWDFPTQSKSILSELNSLFEVNIWVWFREPVSFIESYYKQCIRNPKVSSNPCYGKDLSVAQMLDIDWFVQHLDYQGFVNDCQGLFGEDSVYAFEYNGDVVQQVSQRLGLATPHDNPTPRQNQSLNAASVNILRVINRYNLKAKDKEQLLPHIKQMNTLLDGHAKDNLLDEESKQRVLQLVKPTNFVHQVTTSMGKD
ncbi:sulfotransferase family protein [Paraglaciecola aquimarina]|uniref:Sulfotransferase family protein n=1 Tax=Paraglaciecola aquimarina TaxID=1235557 RepID=A0ABU3T177_9ALTE|nr:sulfotransferase family protein [Paraglaciecola aquimarina]MDU0355932.1 sulfotransferase family protein [Paraglaciecola aquimarina]